MATGDTVPGKIRIMKKTVGGSLVPVVRGIDYDLADKDTTGTLYINPSRNRNLSENEEAKYTNVEFHEDEKILIQHLSRSLAEAVQYDADEFDIGIIVEDLNTGDVYADSLNTQDQALGSDPTTSTSDYVTIFEYTISGRKEVGLHSKFRAAAIETS